MEHAVYWGERQPSSLPATHPEFAYYDWARGILLFGRPVRSTSYVYKVPIERGHELGAMLDAEMSTDDLMPFLEKHEVRWSQHVTLDGREGASHG